MHKVYAVCCGLDVHKRSVVACLNRADEQGNVDKQVRTFSTMTHELLALADWLAEANCSHVAMESMGVYWKPLYNVLEGQCQVILVNAQHMKAVPGRKTDVKDAEWIAELLQHGLLRGSFIPSAEQREWRDLTRYRRNLVEERSRILNRIEKVLEDTNIKLSSVVSQIDGVSSRLILQALIDGQTDPSRLADLARGRLRQKRDALQAALVGRIEAHHRFLLAECVHHLDYLTEAIERINQQLEQRLVHLQESLTLLDAIPGINQVTAQVILAEIGQDLSRFPSAKHLASWAGLCPGNNESAGKQRASKTRHGNPALRQALLEAAHGAVRTKDSYFMTQFKRLAARRGKKRAVVAVAHSLLVVIYHVLSKRQPYQDLGSNYFDERNRDSVQRRAVRRLRDLGFEVQLSPLTTP